MAVCMHGWAWFSLAVILFGVFLLGVGVGGGLAGRR